MSTNINKLIKKHCPNGVPHKRLGEIASFTYGYTDKAKEKGNARFIRITDIDANGRMKKNDAKYIDITDANRAYLVKTGDLLVARTGATFGKTLFVESDEPAIFASFLIRIQLDDANLLSRFYWHFAKSELYWRQANKLVAQGSQPQFNANLLQKIVVPVPPLPVQREIVRILDKFTKLEAELEAELEARRKQYEYYRNELLTFSECENRGGGQLGGLPICFANIVPTALSM